MSGIRSSETKIEKAVFRELRRAKVHFQKNHVRTLGKPDVALPRRKKAVFIDGDFWHGYAYEKKMKKLPRFWRAKIKANMKRDKRQRAKLRRNGWKVLRVWEHEIYENFIEAVIKILIFLGE